MAKYIIIYQWIEFIVCFLNEHLSATQDGDFKRCQILYKMSTISVEAGEMCCRCRHKVWRSISNFCENHFLRIILRSENTSLYFSVVFCCPFSTVYFAIIHHNMQVLPFPVHIATVFFLSYFFFFFCHSIFMTRTNKLYCAITSMYKKLTVLGQANTHYSLHLIKLSN